MECHDILKCPHFAVPSEEVSDRLMASGAILVSEIFEVLPPLIPGIGALAKEASVRALIWDFVGTVTNRLYYNSLRCA